MVFRLTGQARLRYASDGLALHSLKLKNGDVVPKPQITFFGCPAKKVIKERPHERKVYVVLVARAGASGAEPHKLRTFRGQPRAWLEVG